MSGVVSEAWEAKVCKDGFAKSCQVQLSEICREVFVP